MAAAKGRGFNPTLSLQCCSSLQMLQEEITGHLPQGQTPLPSLAAAALCAAAPGAGSCPWQPQGLPHLSCLRSHFWQHSGKGPLCNSSQNQGPTPSACGDEGPVGAGCVLAIALRGPSQESSFIEFDAGTFPLLFSCLEKEEPAGLFPASA